MYSVLISLFFLLSDQVFFDSNALFYLCINPKFSFHEAKQELILLKDARRSTKSTFYKLGVEVETWFETKIKKLVLMN
jgi:hypothetical protein